MKLIDIEDIAANDSPAPDAHTFGPVSVVLAIALAAKIFLGLGCADTSDDPGCELPHEEDCAERDAGVPAVTFMPRIQVMPAGPCRTNGVPCDGGVAP